MSQLQILSEPLPENPISLDIHQTLEHDKPAEIFKENSPKIRQLSCSSSVSSLSDSCQESVDENIPIPTPMSGVLLKWTNYIHGWQQRFIILEAGKISYCKSEVEKSFGFRGSRILNKAEIKLHEIDECRFDIAVTTDYWYLRASSADECRLWVNAIQKHKAYSKTITKEYKTNIEDYLPHTNGTGFVPTNGSITSGAYGDNLRRHESALSISSITSCRSYKEQLSEMETFRTILYQQIKTLQHYFDSSLQSTNFVNEHLKRHRRHQSMNGFNYLDCDINRNASTSDQCKNNIHSSENNNNNNNNNDNNNDSINVNEKTRDNIFVDFKKEAITFKATTAGIIASLSNCIELMTQREDQWKKRLEKEQIQRRKSDEQSKRLGAELEETRRALAELQFELQRNALKSNKDLLIGGPDYDDTPHNIINEEEFFDAIDAALDRSDQQEMLQHKLQNMNMSKPLDVIPPERCDHPIWPDVERVTMDQLYYARLEVEDTPASGGGKWELFAQDGHLRLYKRELEIEGLVCDPLKAVHTVTGVTPHEVCHQFFSPDVRFDWENTLDSMKVIENINPNTLIFHQIHKRVWPAAQRDTVFWSHIRKVDAETLKANGHPNSSGKKLPDNVWIVCNNSVKRPDIDPGKCLRMELVVSMCCELYIDPPNENIDQITRDQLKCKIIYCSTINPGGWAPASVLRALYKREYPKFMKRFSQYCIDLYKDKPIML